MFPRARGSETEGKKSVAVQSSGPITAPVSLFFPNSIFYSCFLELTPLAPSRQLDASWLGFRGGFGTVGFCASDADSTDCPFRRSKGYDRTSHVTETISHVNAFSVWLFPSKTTESTQRT